MIDDPTQFEPTGTDDEAPYDIGVAMMKGYAHRGKAKTQAWKTVIQVTDIETARSLCEMLGDDHPAAA